MFFSCITHLITVVSFHGVGMNNAELLSLAGLEVCMSSINNNKKLHFASQCFVALESNSSVLILVLASILKKKKFQLNNGINS